MENKVIAKEYVDKNYVHKDKIRNKIKDLTEYYEKEVKPEMYHWGDFTAEEYYAGVIAELNMLLEDK